MNKKIVGLGLAAVATLALGACSRSNSSSSSSDSSVKAAGGARSYADAEAFVKAGATRIGASSGVAIVNGETAAEGSY